MISWPKYFRILLRVLLLPEILIVLFINLETYNIGLKIKKNSERPVLVLTISHLVIQIPCICVVTFRHMRSRNFDSTLQARKRQLIVLELAPRSHHLDRIFDFSAI